jgi:hypothetical protein
MLANLLPGLRDLRAPLAAGYLWLAAGWLYLAPQLPASANDAKGVMKDIYRVVDASDPITIAASLTFAAYMLGILSTGFLTRPVRLAAGLPLFILRDMLMAVLLAILNGLSRRWPITETKLINFSSRWIIPLRVRVSKSPSIRAQNLVVRRIANRIMEDGEYRDTFLIQLRQKRLNRIISEPFAQGSHALRQFDDFCLLLDNPSVEKNQKANEIVGRLTKYINEGYKGYAEGLVQSVVDVQRHGDEILGELELVPERLVGDSPPRYERWDRLRGEAEFRQAVVPPLGAIIWALLARGVFNWPFALLLMVPPLLILLQGINKEKEAYSQLIQAFEADVIRADVTDRLTTTQLHWFH